MELEPLLRALDTQAQWVCLQRDLREGDREALARWPQLRFFGAELKDFDDTAALCELMDVVISVDTSVAHLAGAMGKPLWLLLPQVPDWRWMLERDDSPWYPTARLFRQDGTRDWAPVLQRVAGALASLAPPGAGARRILRPSCGSCSGSSAGTRPCPWCAASSLTSRRPTWRRSCRPSS